MARGTPGRPGPLEAHGTAPDGRLFRAAEGGHVLSKEYGEVWQGAREVARHAGHSVAVLFRFYAKVVKGRQTQDNERIARALATADDDTP